MGFQCPSVALGWGGPIVSLLVEGEPSLVCGHCCDIITAYVGRGLLVPERGNEAHSVPPWLLDAF